MHDTACFPDGYVGGPEGDHDWRTWSYDSKLKFFSNFNNENIVHPFFGKMTKEQMGFLAYKHTDHHLRQFGV